MFGCGEKSPQKCHCCEKKLRKSDTNKSKRFRKRKYRQCDTCKGYVCLSCGLNNICHECIIKETITLDPDALMQTDRKTLLSYLKTLHCNDFAFQTLDSKYLVKQILTRYTVHEDWDPNTVDDSPPQLRRSRIKQENSDTPRPQPVEQKNVTRQPKIVPNGNSDYSRGRIAEQQPERAFVSPTQDRRAPNYILPIYNIKAAEYFDTLSRAELKYFLQENSVSSVNINEKHDLKRIAIEVWRKYCQRQIRQASMHEYNRSMSVFAVPRQQAPKTPTLDHQKQHQSLTRSVRVPSLSKISSMREIDTLSFEELVIILHKYDINPHHYKSTVEMANQVKMLWSSLVRKQEYQHSHVDDNITQIQHQIPAPITQNRRSGFHQEVLYMQEAQHLTNNGFQSLSREVPRQPLDSYRSDHYGRTADQQPVQYANYIKDYSRTQSDVRNILYPGADVFDGTLSLERATFVPEVHHIPLQTVQIEHLPPEPIALQDFYRQEEIEALTNQELIQLLEQHNLRCSQENRANKKYLVEMVTGLWLGKKEADAIADDNMARVRSSTSSSMAMHQDIELHSMPTDTTKNAFYGPVLLHNKQVSEISLLDITSPGDIEGLSSSQLKTLLQKHKVNPAYYPDRRDLILEVRLLWDREQRHLVEGKTVGKNTALREEDHSRQTENAMTTKADSLISKSGSLKRLDDLRRSFFRNELPPPIPSPRASLQEKANKPNHEVQEVHTHFHEERSAKSPTPPARDYSKTTTALPEIVKTSIVQTARVEPFIERQDSAAVAITPQNPVKPYVPVYPRTLSTCSENDTLHVKNIRHFSNNISLADIRALEEIQEMPVRDIRMLLEKYDVEIYPGAETGHLIELVTKLWDRRQKQAGLGLSNKNSFRSSERSKSSEVLYAEIVHVSKSTKEKAEVRSVEQLHLDNAADDSGDVAKTATTCCKCNRINKPPECVFLNCGHMIMCMDCGSKTKECPKCRQYIVRVVRVFKS